MALAYSLVLMLTTTIDLSLDPYKIQRGTAWVNSIVCVIAIHPNHIIVPAMKANTHCLNAVTCGTTIWLKNRCSGTITMLVTRIGELEDVVLCCRVDTWYLQLTDCVQSLTIAMV